MGFLIFALRLLVGGVFVVAGTLKIGHGALFASEIAAMRLVPPALIPVIALFLPFVEVGLGAYLVAGLYVRAVSSIASLQLLVFAGVVASAVIRHVPTSCGCFGPADTAPASWSDVVRDLGLALAALVVALRPPGRFALDAVWSSPSPHPSEKFRRE